MIPRTADAAYVVRGNSMAGMDINDGDVVLVRREPEPSNGEIVVAWLAKEGGCVLKLLRYGDDGPVLVSVSPNAAPPIPLDEAGGDRVFGVYVKCLARETKKKRK